MTKPLVIHHGNGCPDGFTAAWVAHKFFAMRDGCDLHAGEYGKEPPDVRGRDVVLVDFAYKRHELTTMGESAKSILILDHHIGAQRDLAAGDGFVDITSWTGRFGWSRHEANVYQDYCEGARNTIYTLFDMERSGAGITWDFFFEGTPRPWIVDFVEDRDIWRFKLPNSEAVSLYIRAAEHTLEAWDEMAAMELDQVLEQAAGCKRYLDHYVRDALRQVYRVAVDYQAPSHSGAPAEMDWHTEPGVAVNCTYTGVSDVLHSALEAHPGIRLALGWQLRPDGMLHCSLRSTKDFDCSVVAKYFHGGGHAQASGFRLSLDHSMAQRLLRPEVKQ